MRPVKNGSNPDQMQPRAAYFALQSLWLDGDFTCDGKVDGNDFTIFQACMTGPDALYTAAPLPSGCEVEKDVRNLIPPDFDRDGDVDQEYFGLFQNKFTGS